jgi:diguanylate cyclase (GGDEF)-like protein
MTNPTTSVRAADSRWRRGLTWLPEGSTLPEADWAVRHQWVLVVLWLHVPAIFLFALLRHQSPLHSAVESGIVAWIAVLATMTRDRRRLSTQLASVGLLTCSAVLVHLSGGQIEMHFHYFVMVGVITLYQDWSPFLIAIGYVVLQHGLGGLMAPESVYNHHSAIEHPWVWAGVHGGFILAMSAVGIVTWRLNEALLRGVSDREERLSEAQEVAHLGSWDRVLPDGEATWSPEFFRLLDLDPSSTTAAPARFMERVHPEDEPAVRRAIDALSADGTPYAIDFRVVLQDGGIRWLHTRAKATSWRGDQPALVSGTAQDITERKRAETELQETLSLLSATLDSTADGILVVDADGRMTSLNQRFADMWEIPSAVLESRDDAAALAAVTDKVADPDGFLAKIRELYATPEADSHDILEFVDGRVFDRFSTPQRVNGAIVGRVWSFRDVTEQKRLEQELAHQAFHDALTDLANQTLFRDRVGHALTRAERRGEHLAVLFIDLDNFKTVNDSLGHTAGDDLLTRVAERLQACLRPTDTGARLGGDEFAILLEDIADEDEAVIMADKILEALMVPFAVGGRDVVTTASIGIAFDRRDIDTDQLLRNADLAMYSAKRKGKGRCETYETDLHAAAVDRLEIEGDLRQVLDRGELAVHYQPIVVLTSGEIVGVEALVRWEHPERGSLSPVDFIPLAEETGLVGELGRQVLTKACRDARRWQIAFPSDPPLSVSVNVSPRQLQDDALLGHVTEALEAAGLAPSDLILEVTEGAMMHDVETTIRRLHALKDLGVRLAVDDFGTGYSSLSYLQRFPVDLLKIDRAFVSVLENQADDSSLANAIISLAKTMHLSVVAEGVETAAQARALRAYGCERVQGFFFARPVAAADLERLLGGALTPSPVVPDEPPWPLTAPATVRAEGDGVTATL